MSAQNTALAARVAPAPNVTIAAADGGGTVPPEMAAALRTAMDVHRAGNLDEAEAHYRRLLEVVPGQPHALLLLGIVETQRGRAAHGAEIIGKALPALARSPEPHVDLGNALRLAGKREEAAASYRQAIALRPHYTLAHANLAGVLAELGRFEAAMGHCRTALAIEPDSLDARLTLAATLQAAGRLPEAAQVWHEIIDLAPMRAESYQKLAGQLTALGLLREALYCHNQAIGLQPDNASFYCARGEVLMRLYDGKAAAASFRRAVELSAALREGWLGLSWALRMLGRFKEADACLDRLREIDPTDLRAVRHLPATGEVSTAANDVDRLCTIADGPDNPVDDRISAGFAVGRLLDAQARYDEAFARYAAANALVRQGWPENADRFDAESFARSVDTLIATNTPQAFAESVPYGNNSELPVFVVGMPRSGTTLVEQICASHPRVFGAGELSDIARIATDLARERGDPARLAAAGGRAADAHIVRLHRLGDGALRVVDKMPDNIVLLGVIARLFPRSRIIYCSRDPRDIALSCYFQLFSDRAQFFSYDLADCGHRCRAVQRLAAHWLQVLPFQTLEMNYETLVADLEGESRRLISFLGLEWDAACLDFHRTERTVATVSHWQVRQPIYNSSIGRWRRYEKHLSPLLAALDGH